MAQKHLSELLLAAPEIQPRVPRRTLSRYAAQAFPTPFLGRGFATVLRHLHNTHLEPTNIAVNLPPVDGRPIHFRVGGCTNRIFRCHLLFLLSRFAGFSREERPEGSLPAFAWSDVAKGSAPIHSITERRSLSPSSSTCTAIDSLNRRAMTPEQVNQFLAAAAGDRFENLFRLAFHVGFRPGELLALKWGDLDTSSRTIRVNQNIVWRKAGDWYLKKPKTMLSRRTLPLTDAILATLKDQRTRQLEDRLRAGKLWTDHGFIFADTDGEPYANWNLYAACKRILKAAGLPENFTPYTARHTMATLLIAGGTNVKAVSERLGHSQVVTTLQQYTHVSPGMQANVSEEIERLLNGRK